MQSSSLELNEFHWFIDMVQTIDVGMVVLDRDYRIQAWNGFMENHSGKGASQIQNKRVFEMFDEIPEAWFKQKVESVFVLKNRAFTTWEQRPYIFEFKNYRPITGTAEFMYQNVTIIPLMSLTGQVTHVCIMIYDVTDSAIHKMELDKTREQVQHLTRTDSLTQLNNKNFWEESLDREFRRSNRTKQEDVLLLLDIDHFKKVNDSFGHVAGDKVIRAVAGALRNTMRETDIAGRYGGEKFGVVLLNTNVDNAQLFAERLRKSIETLAIYHEEQELNVTVSLGIAQIEPQMTRYKEWLEVTDAALQKAKQSGRNRVVKAGS